MGALLKARFGSTSESTFEGPPRFESTTPTIWEHVLGALLGAHFGSTPPIWEHPHDLGARLGARLGDPHDSGEVHLSLAALDTTCVLGDIGLGVTSTTTALF